MSHGGRDRQAVRLMAERGIRYQAALALVKEQRRQRETDPACQVRQAAAREQQSQQAEVARAAREHAEKEARLAPLRAWAALPKEVKARIRVERARERAEAQRAKTEHAERLKRLAALGFESEWISPAGLKEKRGWTDTEIDRFLGKPDRTAPNPHCRRAPDMRLYLAERVLAAEASPEYQAFHAGSNRRKAAARQGAITAAERGNTAADRAIRQRILEHRRAQGYDL